MQQLLGDKLGSTTDTNSFLRELFLQRLPASVRVVLASADPSTTIDKLAEMADKVMEVAAPTAPNVSVVSQVNAYHPETVTCRHSASGPDPAAPTAFLVLVTALQHQHLNTMTLSCASITPNLEKLRRSVRNHAVGETPQLHTIAATSTAGPSPSRLFYVTDKNTCTCFLVDTGSEVSAIPPSFSECTHPPDRLTLMAVNDTPIHTYGQRSLTLVCVDPFPGFSSLLISRNHAILGADFLRHFGLLVDMQQHKLIDSTTHLHIQGILSSSPSPIVHVSILNIPPTLISVCYPNFPHLLACVHPHQPQLSTISSTTLKLQVPPHQHAHSD